VVAFVALLGTLYTMKLGEIAEAEEAREQVRAEIAQLEAQIAELEQFRRLAEELEARNDLLAHAMEPEVSFARVLNDLSLAFPSSASLRTLGATLNDEGTTPPTGVAEPPAVTLTFDGYSVERFAPGVETVMVDFDKVPTFFSTFLATASLEEIEETEVTGFNGSVQLNEDARTRRYAHGLPEGIPQ
jgi:Tfp pilus assembly protein PilN